MERHNLYTNSAATRRRRPAGSVPANGVRVPRAFHLTEADRRRARVRPLRRLLAAARWRILRAKHLAAHGDPETGKAMLLQGLTGMSAAVRMLDALLEAEER